MYLYSDHFCGARKALRHGSHSFTCNYIDACLYLVSIHQMAPPRLRLRTSNCSPLLIYLPQKDERLSRPGCLTYNGWFTHISGHPSAAGRVQDSESSLVTVAHNQRDAKENHNPQSHDALDAKYLLFGTPPLGITYRCTEVINTQKSDVLQICCKCLCS